MSDVWRFFDVSIDDETKAVCKLCNSILSRGKNRKTFGTSSLTKHLRLKHTDEFSSVEKKRKLEESNMGTLCSIKKQQQTLEQCLDKIKLWDINNRNANEIHYKIGEMIAE